MTPEERKKEYEEFLTKLFENQVKSVEKCSEFDDLLKHAFLNSENWLLSEIVEFWLQKYIDEIQLNDLQKKLLWILINEYGINTY